MSPTDDADAADLRALRRWDWARVPIFLPALALVVVAWWFGYQWLKRSYGLDDAAARNLPLIAVNAAGFAILKLTPLGVRLSTPPTPRLQELARIRRRRRIARSRIWQIVCLLLILFGYLFMTALSDHWETSGIWSAMFTIAYLSGLGDMLFPEDAARTPHLLLERYAALRLGFGILFVSGSCLAIAEAYRPGTAGRLLPVLLLISVVVPQLRLLLGAQAPLGELSGSADDPVSPRR